MARVATLWKHPDEAGNPDELARYWSDVHPARRGIVP